MKDLQMLVIEDDFDHFQMIDGAFRSSGVDSVTHFATGDAFFQFLMRCPQDERSAEGTFSVILDMRLPGMSGEDVLKKLKSREDWARIPVIVLTTSEDPELISRSHKLGCSFFIIKPVDAQEFKKAISQLGAFVSVVELPSPFRKV